MCMMNTGNYELLCLRFAQHPLNMEKLKHIKRKFKVDSLTNKFGYWFYMFRPHSMA